MNWSDKKEVIKGNIGERIVNEYLEKEGFVVYKSVTNSPHSFDRLAIKDKQQLIIAEIKTKARRNKYKDTGFNFTHYNEYKKISEKHNLPVFIFFVDEMLGEIYGNWLSILEKPYKKGLQYPAIFNDIIYFHLDTMKEICKLSNDEVIELKEYSQRSYKYVI